MSQTTPVVPAPWTLTGNGHILLYRFPSTFVQNSGFLPPELRDSFVGGLGAVMIVDYGTSDVGGYSELLFIPGQFRVNGKRRFAITKIYVSTAISVENGWRNWAIPKEEANFSFSRSSDDSETVQVEKDGKTVFQSRLKAGGLRLPVNTAWLPVRATLAQPQDGKFLLTSPSGKGKVQRERLQHIESDAAFFPDLSSLKPFLALKAQNFQIGFPVASTEPMNDKGR